MFTATKRILRFAAQNAGRNIWLALVTITMVTLSLFSISILGLMVTLANQAVGRLEERIDISVYLKPELEDDTVQKVRSEVEALPGVKSVELVNAAQALERFKEKHAGDVAIAESLLELGANPLGSTLMVKAVSTEGYQQTLSGLEGAHFKPYVQEARFDDYRTVIDQVAGLTSRLERAGAATALTFTLIALLVVFNTVRIAIYTHREEITIMRLVGAASAFIRAPFLVEGIGYAAIATLLTAGLFFILLYEVQPYVAALFSGSTFDLVPYFASRALPFFGLQFVGASLLSVLAATVAMRRYLKA